MDTPSPHRIFRNASDRNFESVIFCLRNFEKWLVRLEIKRASNFFIIQKWLKGNKPPPPTTINSQNTSNQSFEIAILFGVVKGV